MNQTDKTILIITSSVFAFLFLGFLTFFFISQNRNITPDNDNNLSSQDAQFSKFGSCQDMSNKIYDYLKECENNNNCSQSYGFRGGGIPEMTLNSSDSAVSSGQEKPVSSTPDFSATNNQVVNVDEGDFVKTNGKYIFKAVNGTVSITKILPDGQMELSQTIFPNQDIADNLKIHLSKDKLILMGNGYNNDVIVFIYDINENAIESNSINLLKSFSIEGNINDTRLVNGNLFVITQNNFDYYNLFYNNNVFEPNRLLNNGTSSSDISSNIKRPTNPSALNDILPKKDNLNIKCSDINMIYPITNLNSITTIVGINTDNPNQEIVTESILGSGENIYMSEKNLYLANTMYNYNNNVERTDFFKFNLSNNKVVFDRKTTLTGTLVNQFSMDEYNDNLRVAMTKRSTTGSQESLNNTITVLDKDLNTIGSITGLARGERIYSARFMGDKGYIVTFRETDPLFTFDLSDPKNPKTVGELKIPGFSNYLHPIKNGDYLIGVGRDTDNRGIQKGVKISLFDVRGLQTAKEVGVITIGDSGSYSEVEQDHKALLWDERNNMLSIPINESMSTPIKPSPLRGSAPRESSPEIFMPQQELYQGAYFYKVNLDKGFEILGKTSHITDPNQSIYNEAFEELKINRQLYIGDYLYTISKAKIESLNINDILNKNINIKNSIQ